MDQFLGARLLLENYLKHLGNILRKPQKRLREIQSKKSLAKLKPATKTFMEFSTNPTLKKYTGKDTAESLDTTENRYIHYTLQFVERIVRGMQKSQLVAQHFWKQKRDNNLRQLEGLSDYIQVDEALFLKELKTYEEEYEKLETNINEAIRFQTDEYIQWKPQNLEINVFGKYNQSNDTWPSSLIVDGEHRGIKSKTGKIWCPLRFQKCVNNLIKDQQEKKYNICAHTIKRGGQTFLNVSYEEKEKVKELGAKWDSKEKKWYAPVGVSLAPLKNWLPEGASYIVEVHNITEMIPLNLKEKLGEWRQKKTELEQNGWRYRIEGKQKTEQESYKKNLRQRGTQIESALRKIDIPLAYLPTIQLKLTNMLHKFSSLCKAECGFPASMAFIQNPDYSGAHLCYSELRNITGLDDNTLNALEHLEHIGVVDIPTVYERWCLLQVIKVVTEVFGFTSAEGWEQRLIEQIVNDLKASGHKNVRDIKLEFEHEHTGWKLEVWYEKPLPNKKRPDITLNLQTKNSKGEFAEHTLILDAKYYEKWESITKALKELYLEKDYGMSGKNHVFILHPFSNDMPDEIRITPQTWGKHNFYGEKSMFSWEENGVERKDNKLYHKYGFIMLSPLETHSNNIDNIQRLVGMFLQYPFYIMHKKEEVEFGKYFCISCGANEYQYRKNLTDKLNPKYHIVCCKCGHGTHLTHCFSGGCGTTIFKNGPHWSYHKAELLEPFNISCPDCGSRF